MQWMYAPSTTLSTRSNLSGNAIIVITLLDQQSVVCETISMLEIDTAL